MHSPLLITRNRRDYLSRVPLAAILLIAGVGAVLLSRGTPPLVYYGYGMALFGVLGGARLTALACDERPVITMSHLGIHDVRITTAPVPWSSIANLRVVPAGRTAFLSISLVPGTPRPSFRTLTRITSAGNRAIGYGAVTLNLFGLSATPEDILAAAAHYLTSPGSGLNGRDLP